jgi:tetratricopeptide (TPR) repeat protein
MGWLYYYAREYEASLEHLRRALEMNPTAEENHRLLGLTYMQLGAYDDAAAAFREAAASSENPALANADLGVVAALKGKVGEARAVLAGLRAESRERYVSPVVFVNLHGALGEADAAFEWLDRAYEDRRGWLAYLRVEPRLDGLRGDPRFTRLLERMRLA